MPNTIENDLKETFQACVGIFKTNIFILAVFVSTESKPSIFFPPPPSPSPQRKHVFVFYFFV